MTASTKGRSPLLGGSRLRGAIRRPTPESDGEHLAIIVSDYLFGADPEPAAAELGTRRIPEAGFRWTAEWRTDVLTAMDGTEQRRATLTNPRHRFEGSFFLLDADLRTSRQLLASAPDGLYELPLPHEATPAIVAVTGGTLYIDATYVSWAATGRRVYVRGPAGDAYTTTITGVSGGTLNVSNSPPVGGRFPAGLTLIFPIEAIRFEDGGGFARHPVNVGRWSWNGRAAARAVTGAGVELTVYDGWTVLDRRPLQERTAAESVLGGVEFLDNGATMTSTRSWDRSKHRRSGFWLVRTPAEREFWKAFLAERRGMYEPFLFPTWLPDLMLYAQPTAGTNTIRVLGSYLTEWWPSLAHRRLQLEYATGAVSYHTVTSVTDGAGYQELLLSDDVLAGPVAKVSFLETCRLDTDKVTIEYSSGWRGRVAPPIVVVQDTQDMVTWPSTAAAMRTAMGGFGTWDTGWGGDVASGNLVPRFGANTLTAGGSPVYQRAGAMPGGLAVGFDSTSDRFEAASSTIYNFDASTSFALYLCLKINPGSDGYFAGKVPAAGNYWLVRNLDPDDHVNIQISSGGFRSGTIAINHADGHYHDYLFIVDRTSQIGVLVTDLGATAELDISICGALTNAQSFHLGSSGAFNVSTPSNLAFAAMATGDIAQLRVNAAAAIASIRAATGR